MSADTSSVHNVAARRPEHLGHWDKIIIGIDPGTTVMGYGVLGIKNKKPFLIAMGTVNFRRTESHYLRLRRIHERTLGLVEQFLPDEMAIEAPFVGVNVQTTIKLGRAQGAAMIAALLRDVPITEYEPARIKMTVTGNGKASKEQVREMVRRELDIPKEDLEVQLDATDALGAALCHFYEQQKPVSSSAPKSWKEFALRNPDRIV